MKTKVSSSPCSAQSHRSWNFISGLSSSLPPVTQIGLELSLQDAQNALTHVAAVAR